MSVVVCPLFATVAEALDWFEVRLAVDVRLWRGPDGLIRGSGVVR